MIDVASLIRPLSTDAPCGDNLEYDADFQALEVASRGKPEQQFGGKDGRIIPGEEPAWQEVRSRALALFERTRDLRVAVLLTRALARTDGLAGLSWGLDVIRGLLESMWEQVHPQLDPADDNDPVMRLNTLAALADPNALLRDLRAAEFLSDPRLGRCTVRQLEVALGIAERAGDEPALPRAQIEGALRDIAAGAAGALDNHAMTALAHAQRIADLMNERVGVSQAPDFKPLLGRLRPIAAFVNAVVPPPAAPAAQAPSSEAAAREQESTVSAMPPSPPGAIRSRDDVIDMLGRICEFLERTEPTNPAPLLIRRAQRLMTMTFVDILRDVAPEGVASISNLAGLPVESK